MIDFKKELNDAQYRVVTEATGPSLVLAGAGSGKTRTLVYRVAYLLEQGVKPERILLLTFTNKAAGEMLSRVEELVKDKRKTQKIWGGTFHSVANRLLRKTGTAVGLKKNFTILDREDSRDVLKRIVKELVGGDKSRRYPSAAVFQEVLSFAANAQVSLPQAMSKKYPQGFSDLVLFKSVAAEYERRKRQANSLDFDDLLLYWLRLLELKPIREKLSEFWEYILVDEYQDTNVVQDTIVRALAERHNNILVVGDDAQSIYSFRAAEINNILQFPDNFKDAKIFKLEENYRSSPEILEFANNVIANNSNQFKKNLFTSAENFVKPELVTVKDTESEAEFIAERMLALEDEGVPLRSIAVLFRAAHESQPVELELNKRGVPYEMRGGLRFFERAHVKDALAYLRLLHNPSDEAAWYRILLTHEGIGDQTARNIIGEVYGMGDWEKIFHHEPSLSSAARRGWKNFVNSIRLLHDSAVHGPGPMLRQLKKSYGHYLALTYPDFKDRLDDIEQLALFADSYDDLGRFLADTSLQESYALRPRSYGPIGSGSRTERSDERGVILSTIHQAKGLEWNTVFIISLTSNSLPHPKALHEEGGLEEERRLFYVAITRAQRRLYLSYPISSSRYSLSLNQPSQFLQEIKKDLLAGDPPAGETADSEDSYIDVDDDTHSYLPSIDKL